MATYNFTVRAKDETGAFADREFSIQVRNNLVDRLLAINGTNAYSSIDGTTWTTRAGKGGSWCDNQLGKWIVVQSATTYRISEDTINWEENLQFRLKNDPPVYSEIEEGSEEEPELLEPAGQFYDLPFTIQAKSLKSFNGRTYAVAVINTNMTGLVYTSDLINWYAIDKYNSEVSTNNLFGIAGLNIDIKNYSNIEVHNGRYIIYNNTLRGFIVSDDNFESFQTVIPSNTIALNWAYAGSVWQDFYFSIIVVNGVVIINNQSRSITGNTNATSSAHYRSYVWYSVDLNTINIPTTSVYTTVTGQGGAVRTGGTCSNRRSYLYNNGTIIFRSPRGAHFGQTPLSFTGSNNSTTTASWAIMEMELYDGVIYILQNGVLMNMSTTNVVTSIATTGLPTGLVSIATM